MNLKTSLDRLVIIVKGFLKLVYLHFWQIANSVCNKGKSAIPPLFNDQEVLSFVSQNLFA